MDTPKLPPTLTTEQRATNLATALQARRDRAAIKRRLKSGALPVGRAFMLADADPAIGRMRASDLLAALPKIGAAKAERVMAELGIAPNRRVAGLGPKQRQQIIRRTL
jgi:hypothetical protein